MDALPSFLHECPVDMEREGDISTMLGLNLPQGLRKDSSQPLVMDLLDFSAFEGPSSSELPTSPHLLSLPSQPSAEDAMIEGNGGATQSSKTDLWVNSISPWSLKLPSPYEKMREEDGTNMADALLGGWDFKDELTTGAQTVAAEPSSRRRGEGVFRTAEDEMKPITPALPFNLTSDGLELLRLRHSLPLSSELPQAAKRSRLSPTNAAAPIDDSPRFDDVQVFHNGNLYVGPTAANRPFYKARQKWEWPVYPHGVSKSQKRLRVQIKRKKSNPSYKTFPNTEVGLMEAAWFRDREVIRLYNAGELVRRPKLNFQHSDFHPR